MAQHPMFDSADMPVPTSDVSVSLHERALYDMWAFADLIGFRSEERKFYKLHDDMVEWVSAVNKLPEHVKPAYWQLQRIELVPRDHRKSTVCNVLYTMWRIYRNPEIRILVCCNVKELAMAFVSEIRRYFEDEVLAEQVWNVRPHIDGRLVPHFRRQADDYKPQYDEWNFDIDETESYSEEQPDNRKRKWTNYKLEVVRKSKAKEPTVLALSVGQRATGQHYDLVIMDDVVDFENSNTPQKAAKVSAWYDDISTNVLSKKANYVHVSPKFGEWVGAELVVIGTRYFSWDKYADIVEPPDGNFDTSAETVADVDMRSYVAAMETYAREVKSFSLLFRTVYNNFVDAGDGYICPEIFDADAESNVKSKLQDLATFYSQYCNTVLNALTAKLSPYRITLSTWYESIGYGYARFFDQRELDPVTRQPAAFDVFLYLVIDLAISQKARADTSCVMVGGFDARGVLHIVDGTNGRFTTDTLINEAWKLLDKWKITAMHYEGGVGMQDAFGQSFRRTFDANRVVTIVSLPVRRDITKHARIVTTLTPLLDNGRVCVSDVVHKRTSLQSEFVTFGKLTAKDDCLDTVEKIAAIAKNTRQQGGDRSNVVKFGVPNKKYGGYTRKRVRRY